MKILIDIPNDTYSRIIQLVSMDYCEHNISGYAMGKIANGIPLTTEQCRVIKIFDKEEKER